MTTPSPVTRVAKERILVVDDEQNARVALRTMLAEEGYEVLEAADGEEALALLPGFGPAVVLADVRMPRLDGITLLKRAREQGTDAVFVMMTAFASVEAAVEAMRAGAENYLIKPLDFDAVQVVLAKALEKLKLQRDAQNLRERVRDRYSFHNIIGDAPELQAVFDVVKRAAPDPGHRAHPRRVGHRQGAGGPGAPRGVAARRQAVRQGELRRALRDPAGVGALRPREGGLHRRRRAEGGPLRAGRRRHALPRRDRRGLPGAAGEAAARPAAARVRAGRRHPDAQGGRAAGGGHQPRPRPSW